MSNIKYTSDGKKVLVVGRLNAEQTIVQEIFVSAGQEIPSGENFVVKSLHDAPAESWKEKNLRDLEQRYEREKKKLEGELDSQQKRLYLAKEKAKLQADALLSFAKNSAPEQLDLLKKFVAGEITHMYIGGYSPEIFEWAEGQQGYDVDNYGGRQKLDGIKLVSLYGRSDGDLSYRLHRYGDGSGSSEQVFPVCSYEDGLKLAQAEFDASAEQYLSGSLNGLDIGRWQKVDGLVISGAVLDKHKAQAEANRQQRIEGLRAQISKLEAESAPAE